MKIDKLIELYNSGSSHKEIAQTLNWKISTVNTYIYKCKKKGLDNSKKSRYTKTGSRKFESIIDEFGLDDFGVSGLTFTVQSLTKGKIYYERDPEYISTHERGVVIDDNGCWNHIGTESFNERFKEIL